MGRSLPSAVTAMSGCLGVESGSSLIRVFGLSRCGNRRYLRWLHDSQRTERSAHRVGNIARRKVPIMLLDHPAVGVAALNANDGKRDAFRGETAGVGVPEPMEINRRVVRVRLGTP